MSFLGKKFKRVSCENIEELAKVLHEPERVLTLMKSDAVFSFTRVDDSTFTYDLTTGGRTMSTTFRLGEVALVERRDGEKVKVTYYMEGDNVMKQTNEPPGFGTVVYFKREFTDDSCALTITVKGSDVEAKVYYDIVP